MFYSLNDDEKFISISFPILVPAKKCVLCLNKQPYCFSHYVQYSEWTDGAIVIDRNGVVMGLTAAEVNSSHA